MTVNELIELLKKHPPESMVVIGLGEWEEISGVNEEKDNFKQKATVIY